MTRPLPTSETAAVIRPIGIPKVHSATKPKAEVTASRPRLPRAPALSMRTSACHTVQTGDGRARIARAGSRVRIIAADPNAVVAADGFEPPTKRL